MLGRGSGVSGVGGSWFDVGRGSGVDGGSGFDAGRGEWG